MMADSEKMHKLACVKHSDSVFLFWTAVGSTYLTSIRNTKFLTFYFNKFQ